MPQSSCPAARERLENPVTGEEPASVGEADPVAEPAAQRHQRPGQVIAAQADPGAQHDEHADEPGHQPGRPARAQPLVGQHHQRHDRGEQRRASVADARQPRRYPLLGVAEQAERDHVVEHGRHAQVRPRPVAARQPLAPDEQHRRQHGRADRDPAEGDLHRHEGAQPFLNEQEAHAPDQRQRQVLQPPAGPGRGALRQELCGGHDINLPLELVVAQVN